jgi:hypothetical protein
VAETVPGFEMAVWYAAYATPDRGAKTPIGKTAPRSKSEHRTQQAFRGGRRVCIPRRLRLGCEGIVSKKLGSIYRRGRSPLWLKVKTSGHPRGGRGLEPLTHVMSRSASCHVGSLRWTLSGRRSRVPNRPTFGLGFPGPFFLVSLDCRVKSN